MRKASQEPQFLNGVGGTNANGLSSIDKRLSTNATALMQDDSVQVMWFAHFAAGTAASIEEPYSMVVDSAGNVYVAGISDADYLIVKWDSSGVQQWVARYDGPDHNNDYAVELAVDNLGNVYVTGCISSYTFETNIATIKYSSSGKRQWVATYGDSTTSDCAGSIVVDDSGNVYVGGVTGSSVDGDYLIVKYTSLGIQQWAVTYAGPVHDDHLCSLALDDSGNVYATGSCLQVGLDYDFTTLKYSPSGIQQWVATYDGPSGQSEMAVDMVVDDSGNVYVTGESDGASSLKDFATIKYNSNGIQQWEARYDSKYHDWDLPYDIAVDKEGNVYVTGHCTRIPTFGEVNYDFATVKYDKNGNEQWVAIYDCANKEDQSWGVTTDDSANVYVTGNSQDVDGDVELTTVKYDSLGNRKWVARYNESDEMWEAGYSVAVTPTGSVTVMGPTYGAESDYDFTVIRYNASGSQQWVSQYDGPPNSEDTASAITIDSFGNVYIAGSSKSTMSGCDYVVVKYSASGAEMWSARYNGPWNSRDIAKAIAVDQSGNVFVTGMSFGGGMDYDIATVKFNPLGVQQWAARYDGTGHSEDDAIGIAVSRAGDVYVVGSSISSADSYDYVTIQYKANGGHSWTRRYNGPGSQADIAAAFVVDSLDNVIVTGKSRGAGTSDDFATVKYNSSGDELWIARYDAYGNCKESAVAIGADKTGSVYVTGKGTCADSWTDYVTVKYNMNGVQQWVRRYDGPAEAFSWDDVAALAIDDSSNVYVTGNSVDAGFGTVKYDSTGAQIWVGQCGGIDAINGAARDILVDKFGNVYVTGYSDKDYTTVRYNNAGEIEWIARYDGPTHEEDKPRALAMDSEGNIIVVGSSECADHCQITTVKYKQRYPKESQHRYNQSWNLVSLPRIADVPLRAQIFGPSISPLFDFNGVYTATESLKLGRGYWLKFALTDSIKIIGYDALCETTSVGEGWNLIGSLSVPLSIGNVFSIPPGIQSSQLIEYTGGYSSVDTIQPGKGYWIKMSQPGTLILCDPLLGTPPGARPLSVIPSNELPPPAPPDEAITGAGIVPTDFSLEQNYPNPFNPVTTIHYALPVSSQVSVKVYSVLGQEVATLVDEVQEAGFKSIEFDASQLTSGVYYYRIVAGDFVEARKMILMK